jgi:hypothetical protein
MTIRTISKQHISGAMTRRDQPEWTDLRPISRTLSGPHGKSDHLELGVRYCVHTFRGTGMTVFLSNGGSLEAAQDMANHADPRTTKLYDRRKDLAKLSEIDRRIIFE